MTDLETIEAGVAAFYSGDAERAADLFELPDRTDDQIRSESAYQAAIDGRLSLNCIETTTGFSCRTPYHNAMTDAIGHIDSGDTNEVVVEDGVIAAFGFPEHSFAVIEMGTFLAMEGRLEGYEGCDFGPFPESCAVIQLENLDAWAEWREIVTPADFVVHALESWYGGDCAAAVYASGGDCSTSSPAGQTIEYESILGADVSVENCEAVSVGEETSLSCEVLYSNAMSAAVGKPSSVTSRDFVAFPMGWVAETTALPTEPWYEGVYPEDAELRESFREFAGGGELAEAYADAGCASTRSPDCANLIMANLDAWAAWYQDNN
jgi:hypothetical protein